MNKILFQTQIYLDKKLIHRLRVLNPLTNTDIIGNVLYFMVKFKPPTPVNNSVSESIKATSNISDSKENLVQKNPNVLKIVTTKPTKDYVDRSIPPPSPSVANIPRLEDPVSLNRIIHNQDPEDKGNRLNSIVEEYEEEVSGHPGKLNSPIKSLTGTSTKMTENVKNLSGNGWTLSSPATGMIEETEKLETTILPGQKRVPSKSLRSQFSRFNTGFQPVNGEMENSYVRSYSIYLFCANFDTSFLANGN